MSLLSIVSTTAGIELQGSYRGVPFTYDVPVQFDEGGRRVVRTLFPDQDIAAWQDLGQYDGDILVRGIVAGDDAKHQLDLLRDAVRVPGPGTLVTPYLGSVQVLQKPGTFPRFTYAAAEQRIGRWEAVFVLYKPRPKTQTGLLQGLLDQLKALRAAAYQILNDILSPIAIGLSALAQVESLAGEAAGVLTSLIAACSSPLVGLAGALPIAALSSLIGIAPSATYATTVGNVLSAPTQAIAATSAPPVPAAVATGGTTAPPVPVDGRITAALILSAASQISIPVASGAPVQIPPGPALLLATQVLMLADATDAASTIAWTSQAEAMAWRDRVAAALDAAIAGAAAQMAAYPASATAVWSALLGAKAAWLADMNTVIGRLPPVMIFTPPAAAPVWVYVNFLYGDDPTRIIPMYFDFIGRNAIAHPAQPGPGPFEVLL